MTSCGAASAACWNAPTCWRIRAWPLRTCAPNTARFSTRSSGPLFAELTRDEAVRRLQEVGVPAGPVQTSDDLLECPQLEARGVRLTVDYDGLGELQFVRTPLLTSDAPDVPVNPAPTLGRDTRQILTDVLELSDREISSLAAESVIGLESTREK